jgi:hypothetical protein
MRTLAGRTIDTSFVMWFSDLAMFVTHYQTGSWTPMDVIGLAGAYG